MFLSPVVRSDPESEYDLYIYKLAQSDYILCFLHHFAFLSSIFFSASYRGTAEVFSSEAAL